jgi:hypothetical protein
VRRDVRVIDGRDLCRKVKKPATLQQPNQSRVIAPRQRSGTAARTARLPLCRPDPTAEVPDANQCHGHQRVTRNTSHMDSIPVYETVAANGLEPYETLAAVSLKGEMSQEGIAVLGRGNSSCPLGCYHPRERSSHPPCTHRGQNFAT